MIIKIYEPKNNKMNKTLRILLQIVQYAIAALLGAGGTYTLMS